MVLIHHILFRGLGVDDADISFKAGGNILAGASNTGKSLLLHCLDYILGSDEMRKRVPETEPYSTLFVEFGKRDGQGFRCSALTHHALPFHAQRDSAYIPVAAQKQTGRFRPPAGVRAAETAT